MDKFQKFLEGIEQLEPKLIGGVLEAYQLVVKSRTGLSEDVEEGVTEDDPMVEEDADVDYADEGAIRLEGLSPEGEQSMLAMADLVNKYGYWSEPVKEYSISMQSNSELSDDDRMIIHNRVLSLR